LAKGIGYIHTIDQPTVQKVVSVIWKAKTSVFPDSGLMHFAAASPGGVVALFASSSSSPNNWGPRGLRNQVIYANDSIEKLDSTVFCAAISLML